MDSVLTGLKQARQDGPVFIKDFPHYIKDLWDDELYDLFNHSFLIRDPAKTITSMADKFPDFHEGEVGFVEQRDLFDRLCDRLGRPPPVLDSDDLLVDPYNMVRIWCEAGIPFMAGALSWQPGARDEVSWWDGGSFHANLRHSDGLKPQPRQYVDIDNLPDRVKAVYEQVLPHYRHLYQFRLGI